MNARKTLVSDVNRVKIFTAFSVDNFMKPNLRMNPSRTCLA